MCSPRTASPATEPPRPWGKEYFQLNLLALQASSFGLWHGRKVEMCPTLTLSFLTRPRAVHEAKPGSERGILEGLKGSCGPPSRTRTDLLPMVPLRNTEGSLIFPTSAVFFFTPKEHSRLLLYQNGHVNICATVEMRRWCKQAGPNRCRKIQTWSSDSVLIFLPVACTLTALDCIFCIFCHNQDLFV